MFTKITTKEYNKYELKEKYEVVYVYLRMDILVLEFSNNFDEFYSKDVSFNDIHDFEDVTNELVKLCSEYLVSSDTKKGLIYYDFNYMFETDYYRIFDNLERNFNKDNKLFDIVVSSENEFAMILLSSKYRTFQTY